ncbi:MAG: tetratricopeptide repeat protein [Methyloceanibacter sp.]|uniref:tetratricopeptide repeat protein n=1 Tax=Methyloceanibacter sp. TaxID=1965321 RepID=UPI003C38A6E5
MKAVELRSDDAIALERRGHIHKALGQKAKAIADFRKALELDPSTKGIKESLQRLGEEH